MSTWGDIAIAFVSGGAGGALTSLLTPWAQWSVDKRRDQRQRRVKIIEDARALVGDQGLDRTAILTDPRYLAIRPYLSAEAETTLRQQAEIAVRDPYGTTGNPWLAVIRKESDRLADEWEL